MAGLGRRTFSPGEVLTASNTMNYLMDQVVQNYAGTVARGSAIGSAVSQGMVSYLDDSNSLEVYKTVGTAVAGWEPVNLAQSPNVIINGAFEINQRGFTSITTSALYGFDRWRTDFIGGTITSSAQTFTPGTFEVSDIPAQNFLRVVTSGQSAAGDYALIKQPIEDVRTLAGKTATVSFWAKAASGTPKISVEFQQQFVGTGAVNTDAGQVTLSTSWARYSVTANIPTVAGKTLAAGNNLGLHLWVYAGSNFSARTGAMAVHSYTFDVWGVQVEAGQTATPFRRNANSLQGELAACQRYFYRATAAAAFSYLGCLAGAVNTSLAYGVFQLPVTMRSAPTSVQWSNIRGMSPNDTIQPNITNVSININLNNNTQAGLDFATSAGFTTTNIYYQISASNTVGAFLAVSAEL